MGDFAPLSEYPRIVFYDQLKSLLEQVAFEAFKAGQARGYHIGTQKYGEKILVGEEPPKGEDWWKQQTLTFNED